MGEGGLREDPSGETRGHKLAMEFTIARRRCLLSCVNFEQVLVNPSGATMDADTSVLVTTGNAAYARAGADKLARCIGSKRVHAAQHVIEHRLRGGSVLNLDLEW